MEFFDTAYILIAPILLLLSILLKKPYKFYCLNVLAVVNVVLIFHSVFIVKQLYNLYIMSQQLGIKVDPNMKIEIGWQDVKLWLTILIPFVFLIKPLMANRLLSLTMLFLLLNTWLVYVLDCIKGNSNFYFNTFTTYHFMFKLMNYCCWVLVIYVIFNFIKYLPYTKKMVHIKRVHVKDAKI